ncbi:Uncharacterised protein [Streptococcus pneumoniae]|nr:Uncharacterised protein [Streptococcus pneumoniae]
MVFRLGVNNWGLIFKEQIKNLLIFTLYEIEEIIF